MVGMHCKNKLIRMLVHHLIKKLSNKLRVFYRGIGYFTNSAEAISLKFLKTLFKQIPTQCHCILIIVILWEFFVVGVQTYALLAVRGGK